MSASLPPNGTTKLYSDKGHTSIPKEVREALGLREGDVLRAVAKEGQVVMIPEEDGQDS